MTRNLRRRRRRRAKHRGSLDFGIRSSSIMFWRSHISGGRSPWRASAFKCGWKCSALEAFSDRGQVASGAHWSICTVVMMNYCTYLTVQIFSRLSKNILASQTTTSRPWAVFQSFLLLLRSRLVPPHGMVQTTHPIDSPNPSQHNTTSTSYQTTVLR